MFADIKIVLDFVPNHTSNESVWFEEALKGHEKFFDYFVWEDPVEDENGVLHPPNNWVSLGIFFFFYEQWPRSWSIIFFINQRLSVFKNF